MSTFPGSLNPQRAVLVTADPETGDPIGIFKMQFNPVQLQRSLKVRGVGGEGGDRSQSLRLTGPPTETIQIDLEFDASDKLAFPRDNPDAVEYGLGPELAALENLVYPSAARLRENHELASSGMLEVLPAEAPLTLFGWGKNRYLAVRLTSIDIVEKLFDHNLNPVQAEVKLGMQVLSINDLPYENYGNSVYMAHHALIETLREKQGGVHRPTSGKQV